MMMWIYRVVKKLSVRQHEEERQQREQFLKKENEILNRHKGELIEQKWILEMENNRLREALEFYGDRKNYGKEEVRNGLWVHNSAMGITFSNIHHDDGETARKALEGDDNETT